MDPHDPFDNAFEMVIKGIDIHDALRFKGLDKDPKTKRNNYNRVWDRVRTYRRKQEEAEEEARVAAESLANLSSSTGPPPLPPTNLDNGKKRKAAPTITPGTSARNRYMIQGTLSPTRRPHWNIMPI